jgi:peptide deformylase
LLTLDQPEDAKRLHHASSAVPVTESALARLVAAMESTIREQHADGLAAVQLGVPIRVMVLRRETENHVSELQTLIDPTVIGRSQRTIGSWERCLSVPWGYRYTERAGELTVRYRDIQGRWQTERIAGGEAAVLQHELDHLDGKLLSDGLNREDFIPESRIGDIAEAARRECRESQRADCRVSMEAQWAAWVHSGARRLR